MNADRRGLRRKGERCFRVSVVERLSDVTDITGLLKHRPTGSRRQILIGYVPSMLSWLTAGDRHDSAVPGFGPAPTHV